MKQQLMKNNMKNVGIAVTSGVSYRSFIVNKNRSACRIVGSCVSFATCISATKECQKNVLIDPETALKYSEMYYGDIFRNLEVQVPKQSYIDSMAQAHLMQHQICTVFEFNYQNLSTGISNSLSSRSCDSGLARNLSIIAEQPVSQSSFKGMVRGFLDSRSSNVIYVEGRSGTISFAFSKIVGTGKSRCLKNFKGISDKLGFMIVSSYCNEV